MVIAIAQVDIWQTGLPDDARTMGRGRTLLPDLPFVTGEAIGYSGERYIVAIDTDRLPPDAWRGVPLKEYAYGQLRKRLRERLGRNCEVFVRGFPRLRFDQLLAERREALATVAPHPEVFD